MITNPLEAAVLNGAYYVGRRYVVKRLEDGRQILAPVKSHGYKSSLDFSDAQEVALGTTKAGTPCIVCEV